MKLIKTIRDAGLVPTPFEWNAALFGECDFQQWLTTIGRVNRARSAMGRKHLTVDEMKQIDATLKRAGAQWRAGRLTCEAAIVAAFVSFIIYYTYLTLSI